MNKLSRMLLMLALLLVAAVPLSAQLTDYDPGDTTTVYYQEPVAEVTYGGHWYSCMAYGAWNGKCLSCTVKTGAANGTCSWITYSGVCECTSVSKGCRTFGVCTYHSR